MSEVNNNEYIKYNIPNNEELQFYTPNLMKYLPAYYEANKTMNNIENYIAVEIGRVKFNAQDLLNQLYVDTATWGLSTWEENLGINTDLIQSYEARREVIEAKLRGSGTVTKELLKDVSEAFSGGEVEIIENFSDYSFRVNFIGVKGIPKNMVGLIDSIEDIKPAHLGYSFKYTYTVWNFIEELTWQEVNSKKWDDLKVYG
jgi:hypothetical protein